MNLLGIAGGVAAKPMGGAIRMTGPQTNGGYAPVTGPQRIQGEYGYGTT